MNPDKNKSNLSKNKRKISKPLTRSANQFPVVGIGASAGGLDAFKKLLKAIPENSGMAYVLVQHLDPTHESMLPELLQKVTNIPVMEITDDIKVQPDHIYIIPSNKMMIANDGVLELIPRPLKNKNERNLPIDLFFNSLAEVHQSHAIGVVLSGTASDGTLGLKAIKDHGGITFAQDEESAAYEGMPHSAAQAGVVDFILPPGKIPQKLLEVTNIINGNGHSEADPPQQDVDVFKQILSLLRIRKGTDFTYYKQTTIRRRILRRMALNKNEELAAYLKYLRENKTEQDVLYQDLLIPVTGFFRDPKTFDSLCDTVFPLLAKNKITIASGSEPIRLWVAGCSTGEEAYSIAICLKEFLGDSSPYTGERVQIFATDISEPAIAKARAGIYTKNNTEGLTPQRLQEFFIKTNGGYQANKSIRDMCIFAVHNFLKDPPFGKMDFISCRNVLIYMEPYLQKKALTTFHYSLNPKGFLLLGKSETTSGVPDLFVLSQLKQGKSDKLFTRKDVPGRFMHITSQRGEQSFTDMNMHPKSETIRTDFQKTADDIMLSKYTPAGVVVNEAMDIVHFRGNTVNYLQQSPGKPSHNLLKMAKDGLAFELRNILHKAKKDKVPVTKENIPVEVNGVLQNITIEALLLPDTMEPHYLVLFHDTISIGNKQLITGNKKLTAASKSKNDKDLRIQQLEMELAQSREDMRSITEDQEAANEELQSANEELLSGSEELQSLNEELETGKEELQSTNEELMVVNQEMISLNEQVTAARDYAEAIIANIHEPLLVLDKNLRIKTANNAFYKTFRVNENETEAVLIYDIGNKQWDIPELRMLLEKILPDKSVFNDFEVTHTFSTIGERVMLLNAREVINKNSSEKLILLSIEDITERKKVQEVLNKTGEHFRHLVKELPAAVYSCDAQGRINFYNDAAAKIWGREPEIGKEYWCGSFKMFKPDGSLLPPESSPMAIALKEGRALTGEEIIIERPDATRSIVRVYPQPEFGLSGEITGAINMGFDVTEQVMARKKIEESEKRFRSLTDSVPIHVFIIESNAEASISYWNKNWLDYTGQTFEEAIGNTWAGVMHRDDVQSIMDIYVPAFENQRPYHLPAIRVKRHDGVYRWFEVQSNPRYLPNGEFIGYIGIAVDIHERKMAQDALKESESHFRKLADLMPAKISNANADGDVTYFNQHWLDFTGMDFEELKEFGYHQIMHPDEMEEFQQRLQHAAATGTDLVMEMRFKNAAGDYVWHLNIASPVKDEEGKHKMWVGVTTDISEQIKNLNSNLAIYETHAKELQQAKEMAEHATAIAEAAKNNAERATLIAEEAVKSKQQFLSNMSHEIRTPMNAIIGFTKVLMKTALTAKQNEYLTAIKISGDALIVLINDILDLAKVDSGKMIFEQIPFKLDSTISAMLHLFETKIQEKNLTLVKNYDSNIPEVLVGDPVRLHQIILNLLSNAVKFTNKGKITVNVRLLDEDEEKVTIEFSIVDTGIGIPENRIEKIFENFQQASSGTSRLYGGTGLGLAIVKQLIEPQGGSISVKSKLDEGSVFSFILGFQKTTAKAELVKELMELHKEIGSIKVLVVEDMSLNQLLMKTILDEFGFERDVASNGKIAIEKLQSKSYDIILMDLQMPEMNGFEATEYIRNTMKSKIPIIALTADVTTVDLGKCKAVGMNDYITKPVDEKLLYNKIIGLVKKPFPITMATKKKEDKSSGTTLESHESKKLKCTDLTYLYNHTKSNPSLIMEMISIYLDQTPPLVIAMIQSFEDKDWGSLYAAVHKMIPSFSIMGISADVENMARKVQEFASTSQQTEPSLANTAGIEDLVLQLKSICEQACEELTAALIHLKTLKNE